jgi:hypothetical protein
MPIAIRYHFRQRFAAPAKKAFAWCTDFCEGNADHALMGDASATRKITRIAESTLILTDTFKTEIGTVEKQKLVELYPSLLSWNNTHLAGPYKYSQFLYQITPDGKTACYLDFWGQQLVYQPEKMSHAEVDAFAEKLCIEDADAWKLLAKAMKKDLST